MLPKAGSAGPSPNKLLPDWGVGEGSTFRTARSQHTRPSDTPVAAGAQRPSPQPTTLRHRLCFLQAARKQADGD